VVAQLGPYLIDETLAEGGMARVFRARLRGPSGFEKTLVLKQIRPELARDPRFVEMFVREANTLVQMSHPHIVPVYELGCVDGSYYLSMEFIDGATLARLLEDGPLGPALVAQIGVQLCDALDYAHGRFSILHRDITPRNLIVDDAGHVRLLDFGIAAALDVGGAERFGSPGYMSPEQVRGQTLGPASDLFSLGAVLFEALTGQPAFEKTVKGSLSAAPRLSGRAEVPDALAELVDALLCQVPAERPQSALDAGRTLREWLSQTHPAGAFAELRERARSVQSSRAASAPTGAQADSSTAALVEPVTRPISEAPATPARTFATSPVLTEMLRSATGVGRPIPVALGTPPVPPKVVSTDGPTTRRIETDEPAAQPRATAWMLRWWPTMALLAFAVAGVVMLGAPKAERDAAAGRVTQRDSETRARAVEQTPEVAASSVPVKPAPEAGAATLPLANAKDAAAPDAGPALEPRPSEMGWLTLAAVPWAEVSLDGRRLGTTPLRRVRTRVGRHVLRFDCPPLGKTARVQVTVRRDAESRVMVDLSTTPPRTTQTGAVRPR